MDLVFLRFQVIEIFANEIEGAVLFRFGEVAERYVETHVAQLLQPLLAAGLTPRFDGSFTNGEASVGNHQIDGVIDRVAKSLAPRAGSGGAVEAEQNRLGYLEIEVVVLAVEAFAEEDAFPGGNVEKDHLARFAVTNLDCIDQALVQVGRNRDAVGQDVNGLRPFDAEQRFRRGKFERAAVLPETIEAPRAQFAETIFRDVRAVVFDREQYQKSRGTGLRQHALRHLIDRIALHLASANRAISAARARPQQPHVIPDLGGSGDRGARVARRVFLANSDGRGDAIDLIHGRLFHAFEKLARVGGEGFDVAPLAFGINGVEGEG